MRKQGRPPGRRPDRRRAAPRTAAADGVVVLYGHHPVVAALGNPRRRILRLLATANAAARLAEALPAGFQQPDIVPPDVIGRLVEPDAVHQGLYLEAEPLPAVSLEDVAEDALLLVLDQVTDPHNVGAILRTAAAFGVGAVVTTARHSPSATGVLAKAASGGLEHVPLVVVRNLAEALTSLGQRGVQRIGLDADGPVALGALPSARPAALVLGAEGRGLRERTRTCCDVLARLDLPGAIRSLNVSNAAAVALYALSAARPR